MSVKVEAKKLSPNANSSERQRNFDNMLRAFRRAVQDCGIAQQYNEHAYYEKPSDKKRRKRRQRLRQLEYERQEEARSRKVNGKKR